MGDQSPHITLGDGTVIPLTAEQAMNVVGRWTKRPLSRDALLSDKAVEAAAKGIMDSGDIFKQPARVWIRAALTAAVESVEKGDGDGAT